MGLSSSLQIGRTGLLAHQAAIQTTGNNLANVATPGYHREQVNLSPVRSRELGNGQFIGGGVEIESITRQINEAVESRLRGAIADENGSAVSQDLLARIESIQNELTDVDLSTRLNEYFSAWSQLSTNPQDLSLRTLVTQEADSLTSYLRDIRDSYAELEKETDAGLGGAVSDANDLLTRIESLNDAITGQEGVGGQSNALRDQRDQLLAELSKYLDISTIEQETGAVDVFVGSLPIILNGDSRGIEVRTRTVNDEPVTEVVISADGAVLDISTGELGARVGFTGGALKDAVGSLDTLASQLIFETNKIHSQGQGLEYRSSYTATNTVTDSTAALTDAVLTELDFVPTNGSFQLHITSAATGERTTSNIDIDLDGLGTDTTLDDLAASITAVNGVTATVLSTGQLEITSDSGDTRVSFSDDTSGVLAVLGINSFFDGADSFDIAVNSEIINDPRLLSAGIGHLPGDNRNALALAAMRDQSNELLGGRSLTSFWADHVADVSINLAQARDQSAADGAVRSNLQAQQAAVSGVNADEETINLLQHQRAYQASARLISVVDELMQTLISLV